MPTENKDRLAAVLIPAIKSTVITDASFCHRSKAAGWAAWIRIDGHSEAVKMSGGFRTGPDCSAEAEMGAAINGIWIATQYGARDILLQTDCTAVIDAISGKDGKLRKIWRAFLDEYSLHLLRITTKHVKGHSAVQDARSWVNRWCDENARIHMEKQRKNRRRKNVHSR